MKNYPLKYRFNVVGLALIAFLCVRTYIPPILLKSGLGQSVDGKILINMIVLPVSTVVPIYIIEKMCEFKPDLWHKVDFSGGAAYIFHSMLFITGFSVVNQLIIALLSQFGVVFAKTGLMDISSPLTFILYFAYVTLFPAFFEELFLRGVVLNIFLPYGKRFAIIASALCFTLMHTQLQSFLPIFCAALLLGCIYVQTGNIWLCMLLHFTNNAFSFIMMYINQYTGGISALSFATFMNAAILVGGLGSRYYLHKRGIYMSHLFKNDNKKGASLGLVFKSPIALLALAGCALAIGAQLMHDLGLKF